MLQAELVPRIHPFRRECGARRTAAVVAFNLAVAYAAAWLTYIAAKLLV
jgi:Fe2+ transport system protein B